MKTRFVVLLIAIATVAVTCFARIQLWPITQKPAMSLAQAEAIGDKAMQEKFNGFFCIGARFSIGREEAQEWELNYTNPKGEQKWVLVEENGNAQVLDAPLK